MVERRRNSRAEAASQRVHVRRQFNDHGIGECDLDALQDVRWDTVSGGVQARAPRPFLYAYVNCTEVVGDIGHSCSHGPPPHSIKVCIVKADNEQRTYAALAERASPKPPRRPSCAEVAVALVGERGPMRGPDLREELETRGYGRMWIDRVLPSLERRGRLITTPGPRRCKIYHLPSV